MITIEGINQIAIKELTSALSSVDHGCFKIFPGEVLCQEGPKKEIESASIEYDIQFTFGNCEHNHPFVIGFNETDGVGFEYGEDGDIQDITFGNTMAQLYFHLATIGLEDKYLT